MSKTAQPKNAPVNVSSEQIDKGMVVWYLQLMEQQKERVDALLLAIKDQLEEGTFAYTLADLAKSLQEDHTYWYQLQDRLGIRDELMRAGASHD